MSMKINYQDISNSGSVWIRFYRSIWRWKYWRM